MEATLHNVGGWTARWARVAPERLALVDGERRLTYAELEDRVARTAGWLAGRGVTAGDRVAIVLANCGAYLELVLGAARIGALSGGGGCVSTRDCLLASWRSSSMTVDRR